MDEHLKRAAREGNISDLYALIQEDRKVLRRIDEVEFISTPLHIAADAGCTDFAMEIMSLKPSFAKKLNPEGLSPIHVAVEKGHTELVLNLIENAKDLVRIKGKDGETPLHYVIAREEKPQLLSGFLRDCPESIRDVTTENQTALHIAVRNNKEEALKILCNVLTKTDYCGDVLNRKDRNGDTALHIAARHNRHEMIKLLLKCKADKDATNLAGLTALKVAQQLGNRESISILRVSFLSRVSTNKYKLEKQVVKHVRKASEVIFQDMDSISSEDRNALLVILGLLLTATYQASLSPPGSVWQDDRSSDPKDPSKQPGKPGTSIMDETAFLLFYIPTCAVFIVTFFLTLGLLKPFPHRFRTALQILLAFLAICFHRSINILAPTDFAASFINLSSVLILFLMTLMCVSYLVSRISVLILGTWLFSTSDLFPGYIENTEGGDVVVNVMVVCWLLLFLYDELWKGTAVGVGYFLLFNVYSYCTVSSTLGVVVFVVLGCWLFLFLRDEFWKGSLFLLGFCVIFGVRFQVWKEPMIGVGSWLFLSLCRFCINKWNVRCNVLHSWMHVMVE